MRQTPYSFLTDEELIQLGETRAKTDLEVEYHQRLRIHVEHSAEEMANDKKLWFGKALQVA